MTPLQLHPIDQPIFRLDIKSAGVCVELRLHDVPLLRTTAPDAFSHQIPINEWLFQGKNLLETRLRPEPGQKAFSPHATFSIAFRCHYKDTSQSKSLTVGELHWLPPAPTFPGLEPPGHTHPHSHDHGQSPQDEPEPFQMPDDDGPIMAMPGVEEIIPFRTHVPDGVSPDGSVLLTAAFPMPPPWPLVPWSKAGLLKPDLGTQHALLQWHRTVHTGLAIRQFSTLDHLFLQRRQALMEGYYLSDPELLDAELIFRLLSDRQWSPDPLPHAVRVEPAGHQRLARLVGDDGEPILRLSHETNGLRALINTWWMHEAGQWLCVR